MTLVSLESETLGYNGEAVLRDVSLSVEAGETLVLIGESGAGKSTLLAHLYGLCAPNAALVPQELGLADNLSVFHNVYMGRLDKHSLWTNLRNLIWPGEPFLSDVRALLSDLDIEDKWRVRPTALSGGQRQRVAVARALVHRPAFVLADEPTGNLDSKSTDAVMNLIGDLHAEGTTIVVITHDTAIAASLPRQLAVHDGAIVSDSALEGVVR